jgi:hypothetical protein
MRKIGRFLRDLTEFFIGCGAIVLLLLFSLVMMFIRRNDHND